MNQTWEISRKKKKKLRRKGGNKGGRKKGRKEYAFNSWRSPISGNIHK